jgi:hypothetical protein
VFIVSKPDCRRKGYVPEFGLVCKHLLESLCNMRVQRSDTSAASGLPKRGYAGKRVRPASDAGLGIRLRLFDQQRSRGTDALHKHKHKQKHKPNTDKGFIYETVCSHETDALETPIISESKDLRKYLNN